MDVEKLIYVNENGDSLEFSPLSVFHCNVSKDAMGLSDIRNTIYSVNSMGQHGSTYVGQRFEPREIQIAGCINEKEKEEALKLRRKMQRVLNPELSAQLFYQYKDFVRVIDCKSESAPVFKRSNILIDYTIQLMCCNPCWKDTKETKVELASWVSSWQFPFQITKDGMEMGHRAPSLIVHMNNDGDIKSGMRIVFKAKGTLKNPKLLNVVTKEFMKVNTTMNAGDVITVNTEYGQKGAVLERANQTVDYFRNIDIESTFLQLDIGENVFNYSTEDENTTQLLEVSIYHANQYLGV